MTEDRNAVATWVQAIEERARQIDPGAWIVNQSGDKFLAAALLKRRQKSLDLAKRELDKPKK